MLQSAHECFTYHPVTPIEGNNEFEQIAQELHDDIVRHKDFWFSTVFHPDKSSESIYAERAVAILDTLTTIVRETGEIQRAYKILCVAESVLKCYQEMTSRSCDRAQKYCCGVLTYKHNLISLNTNTQLEKRTEAINSFRQAIQHEIEEDCGVETQNWNLILPIMFGANYINLTTDKLAKISDEKIWFALRQSIVTPMPRCGYCRKKEKNKNEFMICSRCKQVAYCSRECQKAHWKGHKNICKKN